MKTSKTAMTEILGDFDISEPAPKDSVKSGGPVTIWLRAKDKERYDKFQKMTGRRVGKRVRELIVSILDALEDKAS